MQIGKYLIFFSIFSTLAGSGPTKNILREHYFTKYQSTAGIMSISTTNALARKASNRTGQSLGGIYSILLSPPWPAFRATQRTRKNVQLHGLCFY